MIKLTDATIRCMEERHGVLGIDSQMRGCVYFTDADRSGLVIMRREGSIGVKANEIKDFLSDMKEISEVWFDG